MQRNTATKRGAEMFSAVKSRNPGKAMARTHFLIVALLPLLLASAGLVKGLELPPPQAFADGVSAEAIISRDISSASS